VPLAAPADYPAGIDLDGYVYQQTPDGLVLVGGSSRSGTSDVRSGRDAVTLVAWLGLLAGTRSLALVTFTDGTNVVGHTAIRVDA
jgi:hypothetical protein